MTICYDAGVVNTRCSPSAGIFLSAVIASSRLLLLAPLFAGAGCDSSPREYFPLDEGHRWQYRATLHVLDETTRTKELVRNTGVVEHDGQKVSVFEYPGGARRYYARSKDGIKRIATARGVHGAIRSDNDEHFILREPVETGTSWQLTSQLVLAESVFYEAGERIRDRRTPVVLRYRIESTDDEVDVPAGLFERCVRVHAAGSAIVRVNQGANFGTVQADHSDWYAPGVGLVKSRRVETSDSPYLKRGEYLLELERWE
ncbi:MAG: hypothetical protein ACT4NU_09485 [Chromatiales bacterium]